MVHNIFSSLENLSSFVKNYLKEVYWSYLTSFHHANVSCLYTFSIHCFFRSSTDLCGAGLSVVLQVFLGLVLN